MFKVGDIVKILDEETIWNYVADMWIPKCRVGLVTETKTQDNKYQIKIKFDATVNADNTIWIEHTDLRLATADEVKQAYLEVMGD